jgi:hypothetical protein
VKIIATLLKCLGIGLIVLEAAFLSPISDVFPVNISAQFFNPFASQPNTHYYRIASVEHSVWVEIAVIAIGAVLLAVGHYMRQRQ